MLLVRRRAAPDVIEAFLDTDVFKQVHELERYDPIALAHESIDEEELFKDLSVGDRESARRIYQDPSSSLNLGNEDIGFFEDIAVADPSSVSDAFRQVLTRRLADYVANGIEGIEDYVRGNGVTVSPANEIRSGLSGVSGLERMFGGVLDRVGSPVSRDDETSGARRLHWAEKRVDGDRVIGLLDQLVAHMGDRGIAVEIHYYASSMYNSMVTLAAALPFEDQTLVFAINHTYTDQVTGFGASLRKRIGRNQAAAALASHLERVKEQLENDTQRTGLLP
jgi:hypothetical protein